MPPAEARRQALLKFGSVEAIGESYRDQGGLPFVKLLIKDIRYALRSLRKAPAFTITSIVTLALGIGATTSIFTFVHAVLLKSLPVANPGKLYRLGKESRCCYFGGYSQEKEFSLVSYQLYQHFRDNTKEFDELAAFSANQPLFGVRRAGSADQAQSYPGEYVSGNYFAMFGVRAYTGRTIANSDDQPGAPPTAMMTYRLWQARYGSDPSIIGSVFDLNGKAFTLIGITPPGFFGDTLLNHPPDFFLPLNTELLMDGDLKEYATHWLHLIGRIHSGAAPAAIEARMRVELTQWLRSHWGEMDSNERAKLPNQTLFLAPGGAGITSMREEYEDWLKILMMVSGTVLLIVCANVANLMLVRGMARRRQIALSMALGARAARIIRQALAESVFLGLLGGAAGLGIAFAVTRLILHFAFPSAAGFSSVPISASPSLPVLLFAFAISLTAGIAFGIAPAWMATRTDPIEALRAANRSTVRMASLPRKTLVILQAALSLVLLSASGLLTAALQRLENQNFGFDQDRRMIVNFEPRLAGYRAEQLTPLYQRVHDALAAIPGVNSVALCIYSPFGGNNWGAGIWVDGHPAPGPSADIFAFWDRATAGYFDVTGNPILRGRGIEEQDAANSRHVAVINESFARKFFGNEDPIGRHFGQHGAGSEREYEIVGIAKDARYLTFQLARPIPAFFFLPESQHDISPTGKDLNPGSHFMHDIVIVTQPGVTMAPARLRQAMASIDANLPVSWITTLNDQIERQFSQQRLIARLTSFFGILSLVLASVGLYGVTAYNAGLRTNEIGLRMVLGASRKNVVTLVLRGAFALIAIGLLLGLPLSAMAGRLLGSQLYGLSPYDPAVSLAAVLMLAVSALAAALIPALRASWLSPIDALRVE